MRARDKLKVVDMVELARDLVPKQPASTTRRDSPSTHVFRITPDKITESAFMGNLLSASDDADLVDGTDFRAEAAVHAKNFAVNDGTENEKVEDLATGLPD